METVVAIFSYRRSENLARIRECLKGVALDKVYHFCDGSRGNGDNDDVEMNRKIALSFSAFQNTEIIFREENLGLKRNVIAGLDYVFSRHNSAIILEDDVIPRVGLWDYMQTALEYFKGHSDIFSISAYHPVNRHGITIPDFFLTHRFLCWGWATWRDRWERVSKKLKDADFTYRNYWDIPTICGNDYRWALRSHYLKRKEITWAYSIGLLSLELKLAHLCCKDILIENVGFDAVGENCSSQDKLCNSFPLPTMNSHRIPNGCSPQFDHLIDQAIAEVYCTSKKGNFEEVRRRLNFLWHRYIN